MAGFITGSSASSPAVPIHRIIEPDLAERWETTPDGKAWTFHLRQDVKFHGDWGTLSADDVVYSLQRSADPKRSTFSSDFAAIDKVEKLDDLTVRVTLKYADVNFLGRVSNYHGGNIVSRKAAEELGDKFGTQPVGTGPFTFVEQVTQQYVKLAAHPGYFRGKPKLDTIMVRNIPSDSARELAFTSGEIDLMYGRREQRWVNSARKRPGFNVEIFQPGEFRLLHLNQSIPPLDDIRVRRAVAAAVNVDDLVRFVGKDVGPKGCSVVPPGYLGEDCSVRYGFDLAKAKALLAEAGHKDGITIKAIVSNISAQQPFMEIIQAQLAKAGIKLEMQVVDHATYQSQTRKDLSGARLLRRGALPDRRHLSQRVLPLARDRRHADRRDELLALRRCRQGDRAGPHRARCRRPEGALEGGAAEDHGRCLRHPAVRAAPGLGPRRPAGFRLRAEGRAEPRAADHGSHRAEAALRATGGGRRAGHGNHARARGLRCCGERSGADG